MFISMISYSLCMQLTMVGFYWDPPRVPTYYISTWVVHTSWGLIPPDLPIFRTLVASFRSFSRSLLVYLLMLIHIKQLGGEGATRNVGAGACVIDAAEVREDVRGTCPTHRPQTTRYSTRSFLAVFENIRPLPSRCPTSLHTAATYTRTYVYMYAINI